MHTVRTLWPWEWPSLRRHLLRLDAEDQRLRFGLAPGTAAVDEYLKHIDWVRDRLFVCTNSDGEIIGAVHVGRLNARAVELAFSVERPYRAAGVGTALAERGMLWARNQGYGEAHVYCLFENTAMRRLAARCGMRLTCDGGHCEGSCPLAPPTLASWLKELTEEGLAVVALWLALPTRGLGWPRAGRLAASP